MTARKTEQKRREEYLALYKLVMRMKELGSDISKRLANELKDLGFDERKIELYLRMPCISCNNISRCIPQSNIISIFSCRAFNISADHHRDVLKNYKRRIFEAIKEARKTGRTLPIKITEKTLEEFEKELIMLRLPGRLRIIYNTLYYDEYGV